MKKNVKNILSILVIMILLCGQVYASADDTIQLDWYGDYANMELIISLTLPVNYKQNITAVMYPASISNPTFDDYCRISEVSARGKEKVEIRFKITDNLDADKGAYKILIQGNGYQSSSVRAELPVWILRKADISGNNGILSAINSATADTVKQYIDQVVKALQLEMADLYSDTRLATFIQIRNSDYNQSYKSMNDVRDAWITSDVIDYLRRNNPDLIVLESKFTKAASVLKIDVSNSDYIRNRTSIYQNMIMLNASFNNGSGTKNYTDTKELFCQAKLLAVINNATLDNMERNLATYYSELGISAEVYGKFISYSTSDRQRVSRQLFGQRFTKVSDIAKKFAYAVNQVAQNEKTTSVPESGGASQGNSGSMGGGFSMVENADNKNEKAPNTESEFADCTTSHWAYNFVKNLKEYNIISGYPDGKFYPEQTVNREEFVKMIVLASGLYSDADTNQFRDILQDGWYYHYVATGYNLKIIYGISDGIFGVGQDITREDVAVIVYRILNMLDSVNVNNSNTESLENSFFDIDDVSAYALLSVATLSNMNILNGFENGTFRPQMYLTRAQAVSIISKFIERIQK